MSEYIGELEQMVLLAVLQLGDAAYGVAIMGELAAKVDREVSRGAMYATLDRLEGKGLLASELGEPTPQRGGRGKRYVTVTPAGVAALKESRAALHELWRGLDPVLGEVE
jgi:DNA-binding PadR family transcriptional regulator